MHESLIKFINGLSDAPLNESEIELVKQHYIPKKIRKKQFFLQEGDVCGNMAFVVKGAMRQYSIDKKGNEHIVRLAVENWWVGDRDSFLMLTPSRYNVDAWENCELLLISKSNMYLMQELVPAISQTNRRLDERNYISMQARVNSLISMSAEQRYHDFIRSNPAITQRFPQHQIASFLGITKETLSRLRKQEPK